MQIYNTIYTRNS